MARTLSALSLAAAAGLDGAFAASLCMDLPQPDLDDLFTQAVGSRHGHVQVWDCLRSDHLPQFARGNQQWLVDPWTSGDTGGPQKIHSQALEMLCLDLAGGDTTNGNAVQVWECSGLENQQWVFGDDYHIRYFADQSKCVDAGDMQDGTYLMIWDCNGCPQQNWGYDSAGTMKTIYLSDSRRLQVPAQGRLRGARNASAAASDLAAAATPAAAGAPAARRLGSCSADAKPCTADAKPCAAPGSNSAIWCFQDPTCPGNGNGCFEESGCRYCDASAIGGPSYVGEACPPVSR